MLGLGAAIAEPQAPADDVANPPAAIPGEALPEQPADAPAMKLEPQGPSEAAPDLSTEAPQSISPGATAGAADQAPPKSAQFLSEQEPDDWLASTLIGRSVVNAGNETVGEINDLVTDPNGKIVAALIGAGGFLGIGEKEVAVPFQDLKLARDEDDNVTAMLNISKEQLAEAPDYKTLEEQEVVEGSVKGDREGGAY
jgi:sporulation protein YlmC with PRC-barrel domain